MVNWTEVFVKIDATPVVKMVSWYKLPIIPSGAFDVGMVGAFDEDQHACVTYLGDPHCVSIIV